MMSDPIRIRIRDLCMDGCNRFGITAEAHMVHQQEIYWNEVAREAAEDS
jgi:hypothetical protein